MGEFKVKPVTNAKGEPLFACPFPNCGSRFAKEPGKPEACLKHRQLIADVMFIINHINWSTVDGKAPPVSGGPPEQQGPKIFIPKPGMVDKAIAEARQAAGRGS